MRKQRGYTLTTLTEIWATLLAIVVIVGYVWNIGKLLGSLYDPISGMFILRCIGVFVPPFGAVVGFL